MTPSSKGRIREFPHYRPVPRLHRRSSRHRAGPTGLASFLTTPESSLMTFEAIPGLLADLLQEQRDTREAITSLAEAIAGIRAKTVATPIPATTDAVKAKPAPKSAAPVAAPVTAAPTAEAPVPSAAVVQTAESASEPPSYQTVATVITQLSKLKTRNFAMELLQTFGVNKLPEAKPDQYAAILAAASQAVLAATSEVALV